MKVDSLKTSKVFSGGGDIHYILPHFQREYAWEKENWQILLADIQGVYDIYNLHPDSDPEHFMGALVVIADGTRSGTISAYKLVDGQQRLTTISLFLCVLRDLTEKTKPKIAQKIRRLLLNEDEEGLIRYKLLPTEKNNDRQVYIDIIEGRGIANGAQPSRMAAAYEYIYRQLSKWLKNGVDSEQLFLVISNCLQFVFINLDKRERPFEIFESLNAKGKELRQPDLVRNYIAMMLPEDEQNNVFDNWVQIETRLNENRTVSRIGELTSFLRHYLAFRNGLLPNKGHVYARFRDRIQHDVSEDSFASEIETLGRFSCYYDRFLRPDHETDGAIRQQLKRLEVVESVTAYPFMMGLFEQYEAGKIEQDDLLEALRILENYLVRRFLANAPTNYTNKMFPSLFREIRQHDVANSLKSALLTRNYPGDSQILNTLPTQQLYESRKWERLIFILDNVNQYLSQGSDGYTVLRDEATVEHIMPQTLTSAWKTMLGGHWDETYREWLDTIGNLTLVTQNWNAALSNGEWQHKQSRLSKHALLLNQDYFSADISVWDQRAIQQRAQWLTEIILKIWPAFGTPPVVVSYKGRTPNSLFILGEYHEVTSWREVALKALEFAIIMSDDFPRFAEYLQSTYLSREEKARSRQLSNGWWLYLNLSSDSVMTLCYRIFEQLGLSDDDWEVKVDTEQ